MPSRPVWQGHLRLSLVHCPVAVHKATSEARDVRFNLLNPGTHTRVKQAWKDAVTGDEHSRRELVRGYEAAKDEYVVVDNEELKALKLESTKVIDIERFVDGRGIDRLYWDQPYYLVPDGKTAAEPFADIRAAMAGQDKTALGRLVMANRERIVAVEPRYSGMLLTTLRSREEVRADELFEDIPDVKIDARMVVIAKQIIAQSEAPFEPSEFRDRYEEALRDLVASKAGGAKPAKGRPAPAEESNVIDLMDALRRSLKAPPGPRGATARGQVEAAPEKNTAKAPAGRREGSGGPPTRPAAANTRRGGGGRQGGATRGRRAAG
jgi:DNA end-binding protein Ku